MRHTDDQDHMKGNIGARKFLDLMGIKEVDQSDQIWSRKEYSFRPQIFWNYFFLIFQVWEWETRLLHFILTWYSILKKVAIRTCLVLLQLTIIIQKLPQTEFSHFNLKCSFESFLIFHLNEDHKIHKRSFYFSWFFFFFGQKMCFFQAASSVINLRMVLSTQEILKLYIWVLKYCKREQPNGNKNKDESIIFLHN